MPRFLGDTICQSRGQLRRYYQKYNFILIQETPSKTFAGLPVFIYHTVHRIASKSGSTAVLAEQPEVAKPAA